MAHSEKRGDVRKEECWKTNFKGSVQAAPLPSYGHCATHLGCFITWSL